MFKSADTLRTSRLGHSIQKIQTGCSKEGRGGTRIYRGFSNRRPDSLNIKRLLSVKETQTYQVNDFSAFLCLGRGKSLGSLKPFLPYVPQLCGASILSFLLPLISPLGVDAAVDR